MGHEVPVVLVPVTLSLLPTPTVGQSWQRDRGGSQRGYPWPRGSPDLAVSLEDVISSNSSVGIAAPLPGDL